MNRTYHRPNPPDRTRRKLVLVCPNCGHESTPDGDWLLSDRSAGAERRTDYDCPTCGTTVVSQPDFGRSL